MEWIMQRFTLSMISPLVFLVGLVCSLLSIYLLGSLLWSLVLQHARLKSQQFAENLKRALESPQIDHEKKYLYYLQERYGHSIRSGLSPAQALRDIEAVQIRGWRSDGVFRD